MFAAAHDVPNARGKLWQITRPGFRSSYLLGTFHAAEAVDLIPARTWELIDEAELAVFEVGLDAQEALAERMAKDPSFAMDLSAPPLSKRIPSDLIPALEQALQARGLSLRAAQQMRPWLLISILGFPSCHLQSISAGSAVLDQVLAERAAKNGIPVIGLEGYADGLAAFDSVDPDDLLLEIATTANLDGLSEDLFQTHSALYAAGEIQAIEEFAIWLSNHLGLAAGSRDTSDAVMDALIDQRNLNWMDNLVPHLEYGNAFVAVGALHLPGEQGLIELLRAEGFELDRLD